MKLVSYYKKNLAIQYKIILLFAILISIVLSAICYINYSISAETINNLIKNQLKNSTRVISQQLTQLEYNTSSKDFSRKFLNVLNDENAYYKNQKLHPYLFVIDKSGKNLYNLSENNKNSQFITTHYKEIMFKNKNGLMQIGGITFNYSYLMEKDWMLVIGLVDSEYLKPVLYIRNITYILLAISIILVLLFSYIGSLSVTVPMKKILRFLKNIEKGDFTDHINLAGDGPEFGLLSDGINKMLEYIKSLLNDIKNTSVSILSEGEEIKLVYNKTKKEDDVILHNINDINSNINTQNDLIKKTYELTNNMLSNIRQIFENVKNTSDCGEKLKEQSEKGLQTLDNTKSLINELIVYIKGMIELSEKLESKINSVDEIMYIIKNLSKRIQLISLNASVEAARAGEHGYGFDVVAGEIRTLSKKSSQSAENIENIIKSITDDIKKVSNLSKKGSDVIDMGDLYIRHVNDAFDNINKQIITTNDHIYSISSKANSLEQTLKNVGMLTNNIKESSDGVFTKVSKMSDAINDHVGMVNVLSNKSINLVGISKELEGKVS